MGVFLFNVAIDDLEGREDEDITPDKTEGPALGDDGQAFEQDGIQFVFMSGVRNTGIWEEEEVPPEPGPVTSAKWKPRKVNMFKFVDDCSLVAVSYTHLTLPTILRV